jgi:hypothetical protein
MFLVMYLFLAMPFFFDGMIFTLVFSRFSERIRRSTFGICLAQPSAASLSSLCFP